MKKVIVIDPNKTLFLKQDTEVGKAMTNISNRVHSMNLLVFRMLLNMKDTQLIMYGGWANIVDSVGKGTIKWRERLLQKNPKLAELLNNVSSSTSGKVSHFLNMGEDEILKGISKNYYCRLGKSDKSIITFDFDNSIVEKYDGLVINNIITDGHLHIPTIDNIIRSFSK
jgi:hypothetical protein